MSYTVENLKDLKGAIYWICEGRMAKKENDEESYIERCRGNVLYFLDLTNMIPAEIVNYYTYKASVVEHKEEANGLIDELNLFINQTRRELMHLVG